MNRQNMSMKLDAKEILKYLNEMGYRNITSQQLKEFIRDLKILIKHDLRKQAQKANQENIRPNVEFNFLQKKFNCDPCTFDLNSFSRQLSLSEEGFDSTSSLRSSTTTTISSVEESSSEPRKVISIQIVKPNEKKSVPVEAECTCLDSVDKLPLSQGSRPPTAATTTNQSVSKSTISQDLKSKKSNKSDQQRVNVLKPQKSFIKARGPINKFVKSDPVALYQQYQKEWKKQKLPGEDKHYELRWAIRERMLGDGPCPSFASTTVRNSKRSDRY